MIIEALPSNTGRVYVGLAGLNRTTLAQVLAVLPIPTANVIPTFSISVMGAAVGAGLRSRDTSRDGVLISCIVASEAIPLPISTAGAVRVRPMCVPVRGGLWVRCLWTLPAAPAVHYGSVKTPFQNLRRRTASHRHIDGVEAPADRRESEVHARNGEGQPMVWRRYAQDPSNRDQPTLSKDYHGGEQPSPEAARRFGQTLRKSAEAPDHAFGPGVSEANASALPMSGKMTMADFRPSGVLVLRLPPKPQHGDLRVLATAEEWTQKAIDR
jgi:hypothetical protein